MLADNLFRFSSQTSKQHNSLSLSLSLMTSVPLKKNVLTYAKVPYSAWQVAGEEMSVSNVYLTTIVYLTLLK